MTENHWIMFVNVLGLCILVSAILVLVFDLIILAFVELSLVGTFVLLYGKTLYNLEKESKKGD